MKAPRRTRRPLFLLPALAAALLGQAAAATYVIYEGSGIYTPEFRGQSGSTHFGWSNGTWDGNPDPGADTLNGTPPINPDSLAGASITQTSTTDIVSGSNNIYSSIPAINAAGLQLHVPTAGLGGSTGFTTIIIQGLGLSGAMFGAGGALDGFGFGPINGVEADYVITINDLGQTQWWAKFELEGSQTVYDIDIVGAPGYPGGSVVSVTDLQVDTYFSETGYSSDLAIVPEPSALLLSLAAAGLLLRRRRC
jgi:hypothetical protein